MASSFFGIEIAKTGLFMSQKYLNLTSHNMSNVNTPGYSRQRIITESIDPAGVYSFLAAPKGRVGGGVRLQTLERVRDSFIDWELRNQNSEGGKLLMMEDALLYVESIFDETQSSSLSNAMKDFFNSLQELSKDTASASHRRNVVNNADTFATVLNLYYKQLEDEQNSMNENMIETKDRINDILSMIADYNEHIMRYEISGEKANDLRDKRDLLVDELSTLMDIEYNENGGRFTITTGDGSQVLVTHVDKATIETQADPITGFVDIMFNDGLVPATALSYTSGKLKGFEIMRDGDTTDNYGIQYIKDQLDFLASTMIDTFNAWNLDVDGYTLRDPSTERTHFFLADPANPAKSIRVSDDLMNDPSYIACSDVLVTDQQKGNNVHLNKLLNILANDNTTAIQGTSFEGYLKSIVTELGSQSKKVQTLLDTQMAVITNLEDRRNAVSGVSIDEEVTLMMQYEHMYNANSRMLTALDECLDVLINRTGIVGR